MQVIPVIDLMDGLVVRGVGGRRHAYRPIESQLAPDARPASVARALRLAGFRAVYVADLDAIAGAAPAWSLYADLLGAGLDLWIDAGLASALQAAQLRDFRFQDRSIAAVVGGLESVPGPAILADLLAVVGPERFIFSLDLKHGAPLAASPAWQGLSAAQIATVALRAGVRRMILLDLASVGMDQGPSTVPLCRTLRSLAPRLQIISGGGVRGLVDLAALARSGCDAALVASALHDGRLDARRCARAR
jgi:phosphoribosylformimino-5-aminoimidazole carboxamide ribotide isomerase